MTSLKIFLHVLATSYVLRSL